MESSRLKSRKPWPNFLKIDLSLNLFVLCKVIHNFLGGHTNIFEFYVTM